MGQASHVTASMETNVFPVNSFKDFGGKKSIMKQKTPPNSN